MTKRGSASGSATQRVRSPTASSAPRMTSNQPLNSTMPAGEIQVRLAAHAGSHDSQPNGSITCENPNHRNSAARASRKTTGAKARASRSVILLNDCIYLHDRRCRGRCRICRKSRVLLCIGGYHLRVCRERMRVGWVRIEEPADGYDENQSDGKRC